MHAIFWNGGIKFGNTNILSRSVGPYKIAYWVRKHGYQAQVIDFIPLLSASELYTLTKKFITSQTKIIGLSTTFLANNEYTDAKGNKYILPAQVLETIDKIKQEHPDIKFVLGGYMSESIGGIKHIDATVMNYTSATEDIFLEYLRHLVDGGEPPLGTLIFPKFAEKSKSRIHYNSARNPVYNIESDDFRFSKQDLILPGEPLPLDVSRGCIFACKFCQYPHLGKGKLDYIRGMEYLEQELISNYENFQTTNYYIVDDTFNDTETKLKAFHAMTQRLPFKIGYAAYIRADLIDRFPDMAFLLQESGLVSSIHGIESFHPESSKLIGKAWSGKRAKDFLPKLLHDIWRNKVAMQNNFIVGLPHDTEQNLLDTVNWHFDNNMYTINFSTLGVYSPDDKKNRYSILSEFDRNSDKYGFTFLKEESTGKLYWKNETWDAIKAIEFTDRLKAIARHKENKFGAWTIPSLRWYDHSQDYLMEVKLSNVSWSDINIKSLELHRQYYEMVANC